MFTIANAYTGHAYATAATLSQARAYCQQRLLRAAGDRTAILSNIAAARIAVYDASQTDYRGPGF